MKLLLVEDDRDFVDVLVRLLKPLYTVDVAFTCDQAQYETEVNEYDLFIVDLRLPDGNGLDLIKYFREQGMKSPILVLTGTVKEEETVRALDVGADDYLTKPFRGKELLARLRALLRRRTVPVEASLTFSVCDLTLDMTSQTVTRGGVSILLRRKELLLLEYLLRHVGQVVTRSMILEHIWESSKETLTNTVDVHINGLRRKIDRPFRHPLIRTIHGVGYKIGE